ncbi:YihY/virulence factor BrkB family protein [Homoserinibacter sp. YIM 151385]|uniref:YihY/virulence factor BrkB family protein n=1 Tax=Homoserinibacter sp. YIM 151385 TaxID=2985506 RepID=UPI0022F06214|nr:YihY/virulence factor BrkB family protein [Homoserinibacter sp. YIM 151385]WBU36831.1 YihY/virulence factor BrkB family protein [Homoserinibacter sp. YIM 151385]
MAGTRDEQVIGRHTRAVAEEPEGIVAKAMGLVQKIMATRPVRVFQHYAQARGPLLASGLAYQALFAVFAALLAGFSILGLVLRGDIGLRDSVIRTLSESVPGLIDGGDGNGAIKPEQLLDASIVSWAGVIAIVGLLVTTLGWLASARDAVRVMFDLPQPSGNPVLLKLKDLGMALVFGVALIVSSVLSVVGSSATGWLLGLVGVESESPLAYVVGRVVTLVVMFALDAAVLAGLFRFLAGVDIPWARLRGGALLGAAGLGVLKVLGSALLGGASSNPLLASFAVILGLLIFFNFVCQVILIAGSWIAVGLADREIVVNEAEQQDQVARAAEVLGRLGYAVGRPVGRRRGRTRIRPIE